MNLRFASLILVLLVSTVPAALAAPDPNPSVPQWIEARHTLTFSSLTDVALEGALDVHQFQEDGDTYSARDIANSYAGANRFGKKTSDAFVTDLEASLRTQVEETLADAFPRATSREVTLIRVDRASLTAARVDDYDPPVKVEIKATIVRSLETLGLQDYTAAGIEAVFDAGAAVRTDFTLSTQAGYKNTFVMNAPPGLAFSDPTEGALSGADRTFTLARDNTLGSTTMRAPVSLYLRDPAAAAPTAEDIATAIRIDLGALKGGVASIPVAAQVDSQIRAVSVGDRFPGVLSDSVSLPYVSAASIRALKATGVLSDESVRKADDALLGSVEENLSKAMNAPVAVTGGMRQADLAGSGADPIGFSASATSAYPLEGTGGENLDLALRIGGKVTFDFDLFATKASETAFTIRPPPGVSILKADEGTLATDGKSASYSVPAAGEGSAAFPVTLTIGADGAPTYTAAKANLGVVVDLKDLDISIGKAIGGDMGDLVVDVTVTGALGVIEVPEDVKASFDSRLQLDYLSSDAIRLLRERGLLSEANLTKLEDEMLREVKEKLGSALGADVTVTGGFDKASLAPSLVSEPASGDKPVVFKATTSFRKSLSGAPTQQAAIALYTQQQTFDLPKVQGLDTAYTVILPYGLAVTDLQVEGGSKETGESADGRDQFTVRPQSESAKATVSMAVTPGFVVAKFWPLLLVVAMVLILLVGSPIAFVVMRRRKGKGAKAAPKGKAK